MVRVVFVCPNEGVRASIAAAVFNAHADARLARAVAAAGRTPAKLSSDVVSALGEIGVDASEASARKLDSDLLRDVGFVVALDDHVDLGESSGLRQVRWPVDDPTGRPLEQVRRVRDELKREVKRWIADCGWGPGVWI